MSEPSPSLVLVSQLTGSFNVFGTITVNNAVGVVTHGRFNPPNLRPTASQMSAVGEIYITQILAAVQTQRA